ncbi:MAG: hypothetical protein ACTIOJ_21815, partial [Hafnia alvei]|uniref:hypothetical protein n=1 Tax=Hafnia alvei TaxID=569 RepID=UPI003F97AE63
QPATSIPAGGSKMHSLNIKKTKDTSIFRFSFSCLSLGSASRRYRDVPVEFGAPGMGDTKP